jgi:hypothetical protein
LAVASEPKCSIISVRGCCAFVHRLHLAAVNLFYSLLGLGVEDRNPVLLCSVFCEIVLFSISGSPGAVHRVHSGGSGLIIRNLLFGFSPSFGSLGVHSVIHLWAFLVAFCLEFTSYSLSVLGY